MGIGYRLPNGAKEFGKGGKRGLILPWPLPPYAGTSADKPVWVCEGASDTAAMLGLNVDAVGVPMAGHCGEWLAELLKGLHVVIVADADEAGNRGTHKIAAAVVPVCASVRIIRPPEGAKDARDAVIAGADLLSFMELAEHAEQVTVLQGTGLPHTEDARPPGANLTALIPDGARFVRDYIEALSVSTQTPIEMAALLGMAIASATVCNVARVRGHGDHVEPAPVWCLVLCEPAARKSAVVKELLAPVMEWEKQQAADLGPSIAAAVQRRRIDERRLKALEENAARADAAKAADLTDEAVELAKTIAAEPVPTPPTLLVSEPTPEALSRHMAMNHGRALLASAEADALDIMQGRYSGTRNYGIMLKGHAGDPVRAARVGRAGDVIDSPALAVAMCVQPQAVRDLWADPHAEGRGLLARFAVVLPDDRIGRREVRPPRVPEAVRVKWSSAIRRMLSFDPSDAPMMVELGTEADALYYNFQKRTEGALGLGDLADRRAWGGKLCGLALRFALTLHALQTWALTGKPADYPTIGGDTMRAAIAWADSLAAAERYAREKLCEPEGDREGQKLIAWVSRHGGSVTARDVAKGVRAFRGNSEGAERALSALVASGFGGWEFDTHAGRGGRPAKRFRLVPVTETSMIPGNRGGSGDGDARAGNGGGGL